MDIILDRNILNDDITFDNANIINNAIEAVSKDGGKVIIRDGVFYATTIKLLSNVCLSIDSSARLTLFRDINKFNKLDLNREDSIKRPTWENCEYNGMPSQYFIYAKDGENISIEGSGFIDGSEDIFYGTITKYHIEGSYYPRIPLVYFENIRNVSIKDINLRKSAFWTLHLVGCDTVNIDNINIDNNLKLTNCDGIDPDHSKNVRITNSRISCADDCIVLKTSEAFVKYGDCQNIYVENVDMTSTSAAIKIGTESCSDFSNIHFKNIRINNSNRGISLMLRDNGNIRDCVFEDIKMSLRLFSKIHWWGSDEGIAVTAIPRKDNVGNISNVVFKNIDINSENGLLVYGINNISNITFDKVSLVTNKKTDYPKEKLDLRPSKLDILDSKFHMLTLSGASNVRFINSTLINNTDYIDNTLKIEKCLNLDLSGLYVKC